MRKIKNKDLETKLRHCSEELDQCASLIRDHEIEPVKDNILKIGNAIAEISDLLIMFETFQKQLEGPWKHRCSFCKKQEDQVGKLIQGPGTFICNECIEICQVMLSSGEHQS